MLIECSIKNFAVIEEANIHFLDGFHVFTGETGAGKSMIIDALSLIIGGRGSAEFVRHDAPKTEIECLFQLEKDHPVKNVLLKYGIELDETENIIIRREITAQGKSSSRVNGVLVNLSMLREIGEWLINIHGQHEHQSLLNVEQHLLWLDLFGDGQIHDLKKKYQSIYEKYSAIQKELKQLQESDKQLLQMKDLYSFQIEEIEKAQLKMGEDECLTEEKHKLANAEKLYDGVNQAHQLLYGSEKTLESLGKAVSYIEQISHYDQKVLQPLLEQIQSAYYQIEDSSFGLREYRENVEFNPSRLDEIEQRLALISSLKRKYGENLEEILNYVQSIKSELERMENKDVKIQELEEEKELILHELRKAAKKLSEKRRKVSKQLSKKIEFELRDLQMEKTRFDVHISSNMNQFTKEGWDHIEFMISPNPGEPLRPLHKIASGGEISRIMLALKTIFSKMDRIPVLIFDEVDTGVSGRAAQAIAEKMSMLSKECQVFSITHLPQVACMADAHYLIQKSVQKNRTFTHVNHLHEGDRIIELARMLGGVEVTKTTEHHAKEMLVMAEKKKEQRNHLQL
ncbi:DNA repair protein RecN [Chengkuizengella axinellae]|uniref:DNA repair protein RecN n=1 Tax=Chengkuizengella axinellae TaxID=3064388 RepID=A0ABT9IXT1_9BACL|nr:DNA repair protein RecN [Chengkuizengella sp. 2205SS18-9]MDP5273614.1 DNA repair protein RecN [Chengkuizengella sp. 2205SS18-9]